MRIARAIVARSGDDYARTVAAGREAVAMMREALGRKEGALRSDGDLRPQGASRSEGAATSGGAPARLKLSVQESKWLDRIEREMEALPDDPAELGAEIAETYGSLYSKASYGM